MFYGKEIYEIKTANKNANFPTKLCLGSITEKLVAVESTEVSFKRIVYDYSVNYNSIDISDILNFHTYLMTKNNIK